MKTTMLIAFLLCAGLGMTNAQEPDSIHADLFSLYENSADQEGMFYTPSLPRRSFAPGSELINQKRIQVGERNGNFRQVVIGALNLAWIELESGNADKAISWFDKALQAHARLKADRGEAAIILQKGFARYRNLDYTGAAADYKLALEKLERHPGPAKHKPFAHALLAQAHLSQKNFEEAFRHFHIAYSGLTSPGNEAARARISVQLAELHIRKGEFASAETYLSQAGASFLKLNDRSGLAMIQRDRGIIAFRKGNYESAVNEFRQSLALSSQLSVSKLLKDTYLKLFTIKSLAGNHKASNDWNILYVQLRDSIDNAERSRVVNSQMTRRDLIEREAINEMLRKDAEVSYQSLSAQELEKNRNVTDAEIERLEKEKIIEDLNIAKRISDQANVEREEKIQQLTRERALQDLALSQKELEVNRSQTTRNTLFLASLFLVIVAVLMFTRYRNKQRSHEKLDRAYRELTDTHNKLVAAQEQLVHAQKMASLGQLTAGIAHEIQNPLNFVNNFSEISMELIGELKQPGTNKDEILNDLAGNLDKIHSHGKRADKIVKGMLLHSRAGQADKQPADLNKMIDELLELSYHGNRTRDLSFSAEIIRNFDRNLPQVEVVAQDISRVLINLFNNAFYAVGQRSKLENSKYKPTVGVSTSQEGNNAVIRLRDNGTGIPDEIRKKIFDPFFTTKPAGEGTGLGLSMSYDIIVKGHHGNLAVNSEAGSFTEFMITLPVM